MRSVGTETDTDTDRRTAKIVGTVWGLLVLNTLGSAGAVTIIPLPRSLIQMVTMGSLVAAFALALVVNPRVRVRASAYVFLLTLLLVVTFQRGRTALQQVQAPATASPSAGPPSDGAPGGPGGPSAQAESPTPDGSDASQSTAVPAGATEAAGRFVSDWAGDPGAIQEYGVRFTSMVPVPDDDQGASIELTGKVTAKDETARTATLLLTAVSAGQKVLGKATAVVRLP